MASLPSKRSHSWRTDSHKNKKKLKESCGWPLAFLFFTGQPGLGLLEYIQIPLLWNSSSLISAWLIFSRPRKVYMTLNLIDPVIGIEAHMVNPVALRCT